MKNRMHNTTSDSDKKSCNCCFMRRWRFCKNGTIISCATCDNNCWSILVGEEGDNGDDDTELRESGCKLFQQ